MQGVDHFAWKQHWISYRFDGLEKMLHPLRGRYSHGDTVTMADCCLIPQVIHSLTPSETLSTSPWVLVIGV